MNAQTRSAETDAPTTAEKLTAQMDRLGVAAPALAEQAGVKERTLRSYMAGDRHPPRDVRERLEEALRLPRGALAPGQRLNGTFQMFLERSPLAEDPDTAAVRQWLGEHLDDHELLALGGQPGQWRVFESLVSVITDQMTVWRNRNGLDETHEAEDRARQFRTKMMRR